LPHNLFQNALPCAKPLPRNDQRRTNGSTRFAENADLFPAFSAETF
jgi:hypothetical protein